MADEVKRTLPEFWVARSLDEAAAALGKSKRSIRDYIAKGCPGEEQYYPIPEMVTWMVKHPDGRRSPEGSESSSSLEDQKLEIDIATRRLKYRQLAGELVDRAAVTAEVEQVVNVVRGRLEAVPQELAMSLPVDQQPDFIQSGKQRISLILRELAALGDGSRGVTGRGERAGCDEHLECA